MCFLPLGMGYDGDMSAYYGVPVGALTWSVWVQFLQGEGW